jgi:UV DNA damage endonuclease
MASVTQTSLRRRPNALRLGLCCQFARVPIKFRATTATAMLRLPEAARLARLADLCRSNAEALLASLEFCASHGIGAFRINSQILPVKTHPAAGYEMNDQPSSACISFYLQVGAIAGACARHGRGTDMQSSTC